LQKSDEPGVVVCILTVDVLGEFLEQMFHFSLFGMPAFHTVHPWPLDSD
jgi:hypothetical protein